MLEVICYMRKLPELEEIKTWRLGKRKNNTKGMCLFPSIH